MILATASAIIILAGYAWRIYHTSADQYAGPFINNNVPFSLYTNVILPDLGINIINGLLHVDLFFFRYLKGYFSTGDDGFYSIHT